jgi:hypothetical protein
MRRKFVFTSESFTISGACPAGAAACSLCVAGTYRASIGACPDLLYFALLEYALHSFDDSDQVLITCTVWPCECNHCAPATALPRHLCIVKICALHRLRHPILFASSADQEPRSAAGQ